MTSRKIFQFFRGGAFTEDNRTFWTKSHKVGCILFNKSIVMVYDRGEHGLELARMISFKDVSMLVTFQNGDFFIGQKSLEKEEKRSHRCLKKSTKTIPTRSVIESQER